MKNNIPEHVAIIMDGNRRWAKEHKLPFFKGHEAGVVSLRETVSAAGELGIKYLTVYAFSTENRNRSKIEVSALFSLFAKALPKELPALKENNVKIHFIGEIDELPGRVRKVINDAQDFLAQCTGLTFVVAVNYGGRREIVSAVRQSKQVTEEEISKHLYAPDIPEPDLIVRTGGMQRLSNFLLWESAYTELYFTDTLWPDFGKRQLKKAILDYNRRERKFGK